MKKQCIDVQSYFQDWAQTKKKEIMAMGDVMRGNPLYQKKVDPMNDDEAWTEQFHFILRKGLSEKGWKAYQKNIRKDRLRIWAMFMNENPDYDYGYFLSLLKFKLEWMIFYWENFGHLARAEQDISRMRIATRLLDIIMDENSEAPIPYVNMRNKHRFRVYHKPQGMHEIDSENEVRFRKAYYLFFRFLEYHLLGWCD